MEAQSQVNPFYWSVRRELWENRSIYLAPLIVAAVVLFATLIATMWLPSRVRKAQALGPAKQHSAIVRPLGMAPAPIMLTTFIVGAFYCLDALYGERRDRSILFWKSLPVSDRTTVLAKVAIPLLVLPMIGYALSVAAQVVLAFASSAVLAGGGLSPGLLWREFEFFQGLVIMIYGLSVHTLWFAPIYGWLLLVSAWAKRAPFLWAVLPWLLLGAVERIVSGARPFATMLQYRVIGAMSAAFDQPDGNYERIGQLAPVKFLTTPGLWVGLLFAATCVAAAVRLRRNREPI